MNVVPGLQIGQAGAATEIYIRGVGDFGATPITNPAVAFHVDGSTSRDRKRSKAICRTSRALRF